MRVPMEAEERKCCTTKKDLFFSKKSLQFEIENK
jgi:hypothetical protein